MNQVDPTDIRARERVEAEQTAKQQLIRDQEAEDFKWLMSDKRGRRIVWGLLENTGLHRNPFTGNSETFFRCGEMNVGQRYQGMIAKHCPERYEQMVKEQTAR